MGRYRLRAVEVEARQWDGSEVQAKDLIGWFKRFPVGLSGHFVPASKNLSYPFPAELRAARIAASVHDTHAIAKPGDWLVWDGERLRKMAADEFAATYEEA